MRHLEPNNLARIFPGNLCSPCPIHIHRILLKSTATHTSTHNIKKGQYPRLVPLDHLLPEKLELLPPHTTRIYHRRDTGTERKAVWNDAFMPIAICLFHAMEHMRMHIDQP